MNSFFNRFYNRLIVSPNLCINLISYFFSESITNYKELSKNLKALENIHSGQRCFLIGNGPSVRFNDLEKLDNEITFCCNRFHLCYENTFFRPTYIVSADEHMIKDFGKEISKSSNRNKQKSFFGMIKDPRKNLENTKNVFWLRLNRQRPFRISTNICKSLGTGGASLIFAAQIAYHMGIREMYLYGVDHKFNFKTTNSNISLATASGDDNHFIKNYRADKKWVPPSVKLIESSFKKLNSFLETESGLIQNCSRFSDLPHIKKVSFDSIDL